MAVCWNDTNVDSSIRASSRCNKMTSKEVASFSTFTVHVKNISQGFLIIVFLYSYFQRQFESWVEWFSYTVCHASSSFSPDSWTTLSFSWTWYDYERIWRVDKAWSRQKSDNLSRKDSRGESATAAATTECGWPNRSSAAHPSWWQQWSCLIAISLSPLFPSYSTTFLPAFLACSLTKLDHRKCGITTMTKTSQQPISSSRAIKAHPSFPPSPKKRYRARFF